MEKVNNFFFFKILISQKFNLKHTSFLFSMKHKEEKTGEKWWEKKKGFRRDYNAFSDKYNRFIFFSN